jgi:hypothetical protein
LHWYSSFVDSGGLHPMLMDAGIWRNPVLDSSNELHQAQDGAVRDTR